MEIRLWKTGKVFRIQIKHVLGLNLALPAILPRRVRSIAIPSRMGLRMEGGRRNSAPSGHQWPFLAGRPDVRARFHLGECSGNRRGGAADSGLGSLVDLGVSRAASASNNAAVKKNYPEARNSLRDL